MFAVCLCAPAATSTVWQTTGLADFLKGKFTGLSLSADGTMQLGPAMRFRLPLNQPALWALIPGPDGSVYAAGGHQGKIFRITVDGKPSQIWTAPQSEVFALANGPNGSLYAGTSPNGGVYRIANGKADEIWHAPAKYIWAIAPAPDGSLFIATGGPGRIYRLDTSGKASVYFDSGQGNVTALVLTRKGALLAGTDPNGIVYEIAAAGSATVLYHSTLPEVRAIAVAPDGTVYAAVMGGAVSTRTGASPSSTGAATTSAVVATTPTVITVTEARENNSQADQNLPKPSTSTQSSGVSAATAAAGTAATITEVSGVEKAAIYRIDSDRSVRTIWSSKEQNVYDITLVGERLLFSTDDHGRIYELDASRATLLAQPGDGETTRLVGTAGNLYAAMSNPARVIDFGAAGTGSGSYESQVHDCNSVARWGHLQWHGTGSGIQFRTRTGNSPRPDNTWSDWSAPVSDASGELISSPLGRYIQFRAEWPTGSTAQVDTINVPYLPRNSPPVVHSITVASILGTSAAKSSAAAANSTAAYSITVTDTGEAPAASSTSAATQTVSRLQSTQTQISWQADDPDSDKLVYSVYFRAEDETQWQLIRSRMFENTLLLDPDVFADGRYLFRVVASDAPSNAAQYALQTELVSAPILIDNTPPVVTLGTPQRGASTLDLDVTADDKTSPLRLCEYSLDTGLWQPVEATDGITDSPHERFHIHLDNIRPGEHLLVIRVYDLANNAGLARVLLH